MMRVRVAMLFLVATVIVSCRQTVPVHNAGTIDRASGLTPKPDGYIALPGQAAVSSSPTATQIAFDMAAAKLPPPAPARELQQLPEQPIFRQPELQQPNFQQATPPQAQPVSHPVYTPPLPVPTGSPEPKTESDNGPYIPDPRTT